MATKELEALWIERIGGLDVELEDGTTPRQWVEEGFSPVAADGWRNAGGFNPERVSELEEEGFDADEVSRLVTADEEIASGFAYSGYSIAYMFCNCDLSIEDVRRLVGNAA